MPVKNSDFQKSERHHLLYGILKSRTNELNALTVTEIYEILSREVSVDRKTVGRDLEEMSGPYKLLETEEKPRRYYVSSDFTPDYDLSFNEDELQTLILSLENLRHVAPAGMEKIISGVRAKILSKIPKTLAEDFARFQQKLIVTDSIVGMEQEEEGESIRPILEALRLDKAIRVKNFSPYKKEKPKSRIIHPLLLNLTGGIFYLIASDPEDKFKIKRFRVSRLKEVEILSEKVKLKSPAILKNLDFSFGGYGTGDEPLIEYKIKCSGELALFFKERKFNKTQKIKELSQGFCEVSFKSRSSREITRLLAGFGEELHAVSPKEIQDQIQSIWRSGLKKIK
ncbi:MAG: helix-turn-helix transcriptional regulator [Bacteriovoracaceae bacterium]